MAEHGNKPRCKRWEDQRPPAMVIKGRKPKRMAGKSEEQIPMSISLVHPRCPWAAASLHRDALSIGKSRVSLD